MNYTRVIKLYVDIDWSTSGTASHTLYTIALIILFPDSVLKSPTVNIDNWTGTWYMTDYRLLVIYKFQGICSTMLSLNRVS